MLLYQTLVLCSFTSISFAASSVSYSGIQLAEQSSAELDFYFQDTKSKGLKENLDRLQGWQAAFGTELDDYVGQLDRWLGGSEEDVKRKKSRFIFYLPTTVHDDGSLDLELKFRATIDLPRSKDRWQITLSSFDETSLDTPDNRTPGTTLREFEQIDKEDKKNSEASISLQKQLSRKENSFAKLNLGMKFQGIKNPNPYIRLKYQQSDLIKGTVLSRMTHNVILERIRGFVLESRQSFDVPLNTSEKRNLIRSQTTGTWLEEDREYLVNQRFIYFDQILNHRFYAYFVDGNWTVQSSHSWMDDVSIGFNWREKLYKDWLYAELEPKLTWEREENFSKAEPSLMLMLEMHFYR